jgi:hypothetical protein
MLANKMQATKTPDRNIVLNKFKREKIRASRVEEQMELCVMISEIISLKIVS